LSTITANRASVIAACSAWVFIVGSNSSNVYERALPEPVIGTASGLSKGMLFALILLLGVFEKLSGAANMMSMERDWVVTVAAPDGLAYDLTCLNAVMRRIDLICKLIAPIVISVIISSTGSVGFGVLVVGGMSAVSWFVEWWCAKRVWNNHPSLQVPKDVQRVVDDAQDAESYTELPALSGIRSRGHSLVGKTRQAVQRYTQDFTNYFLSDVWIPSIALSLLHLSVLSYSATFITYLLSAGFSLNLITIARALGSVVEISSTVVTPFGVSYLGKHHCQRVPQDEEEDSEALLEDAVFGGSDTETGLERLGLWGVTWQLLNLVSTS
jgi:iron-regulated transporter 1